MISVAYYLRIYHFDKMCIVVCVCVYLPNPALVDVLADHLEHHKGLWLLYFFSRSVYTPLVIPLLQKRIYIYLNKLQDLTS